MTQIAAINEWDHAIRAIDIHQANGVVPYVMVGDQRYMPRGAPASYGNGSILRAAVTVLGHIRVSVDPDAPNGTTATYAIEEHPTTMPKVAPVPDRPWTPNIIVNTDNGPVPLVPEHATVDLSVLGEPLATAKKGMADAVRDLAAAKITEENQHRRNHK